MHQRGLAFPTSGFRHSALAHGLDNCSRQASAVPEERIANKPDAANRRQPLDCGDLEKSSGSCYNRCLARRKGARHLSHFGIGFSSYQHDPKALNADMTTTRQLLKAFLQKCGAHFVADDLSPLKSSALRSEQVADCYLAELAASKGMKVATLDDGISHQAVEVIV